MKRGAHSLLGLVQSFFVEHLRRVRGASEHTVRAYRDSLRLLFLFLADQNKRTVSDLQLDDIRAEAVLKFLHHIEVTRNNSAATRNNRLAAIHSFVDHLLRHDITRAEQYSRILAIPTKKAAPRVVLYLEPEDVRALIGAIGDASHRDRALLLLLYNTGARVSEALSIRVHDLQLARPRQVRLHGKGGKDRICPLWSETAVALRALLASHEGVDEQIFRNTHGSPLTRDGVAYVIDKYAKRARTGSPVFRQRKITPHVLRHSCAVALLQAGIDVSVIRDYLGHASIATTSRYLVANLDMKRKVLGAFWKRAGLDEKHTARWRPSPKLMTFLASL